MSEHDKTSLRFIARIKEDLSFLEALHRDPEGPPDPPTDPPDEPGTDPPVDPPPTRDQYVVTAEVWNEGGAREVAELGPRAALWMAEPSGLTWASRHVRLGDAHLRVWWEQTPNGTWPTVLLTPRKGAGAQRWSRVRFSVDGQVFYEQAAGNAHLLPMQAHFASTRPMTAVGWDWIKDPRPYPAWSEARFLDDTTARMGQRCMGRFFFRGNGGAGSDRPEDYGAPGGQGVGHYRAGKDDAFCGPWGKANRWAETLGEWWKAIWRLDENGEPALVEGGYWSGRDYAQNTVPGYEWSQEDYYSPLGYNCLPAGGPWFSRMYSAPAAIAKWSAPARFTLRMAWADVQSAWNLDGPESSNGLLRGFQHVLADPTRWPRPTGLRGSRYFAHAVRCLVEAWDYIDVATRERYADAFIGWYDAIADPSNGVANRDRSGGAKTAADLAGIPGNVTSAFQSSLIVVAMKRLRDTIEWPDNELNDMLVRAERFLARAQWAYCWESETPPQRGETWRNRNHSMRTTLPQSQRTPCPDGGDYALATTGEWYSWSDPAALDLDAQNEPVNGDQQPYDLVSRKDWEGGGR